MAPSEIPSRNATSGGTLTLTLGDATATLHDIVCDSTSGLSVIASAGNLTGAQFTVDGAGAVTDVAITLPENVTALVGKQVGSAQFSGSPQRFAVRGEAITAVQGTSRAVPFRIDGSC